MALDNVITDGLLSQVAKTEIPQSQITVGAAPTLVGGADNSATYKPSTAPLPASTAATSAPLVTQSATPANMTAQSAPTVNTSGQAYTPTAYTQVVDPTKTTQGLVSQVMNTEGELMRIASQRGENLASRRGMGNSSIAAQASMGAMIDAALPIAQSDASIYQQQASQNQQAMNAAAGASNDFQSSDLKMRQEEELTKLRDALGKTSITSEYQSKFISQYSDTVNAILGNNEYTTPQKNEYIAKAWEQLQISMQLQEAVSGVNIGQYKPGETTGGGIADAFTQVNQSPVADDVAIKTVKDTIQVMYDQLVAAGGPRVFAAGARSISAASADQFVSGLSPQQAQWLKANLGETVGDGQSQTTIGNLLRNSTLLT